MTRKFITHREGGVSSTVTTTEPQMDRERGERRELAFRGGDRVKLVGLAQTVVKGHAGYDDRPNLPPGTEGTVEEHAGRVTDSGGSLFVRWDNGSSLNATTDDRVAKVDDPDATPL